MEVAVPIAKLGHHPPIPIDEEGPQPKQPGFRYGVGSSHQAAVVLGPALFGCARVLFFVAVPRQLPLEQGKRNRKGRNHDENQGLDDDEYREQGSCLQSHRHRVLRFRYEPGHPVAGVRTRPFDQIPISRTLEEGEIQDCGMLHHVSGHVQLKLVSHSTAHVALCKPGKPLGKTEREGPDQPEGQNSAVRAAAHECHDRIDQAANHQGQRCGQCASHDHEAEGRHGQRLAQLPDQPASPEGGSEQVPEVLRAGRYLRAFCGHDSRPSQALASLPT